MTDDTPAARLAAITERLCWREATPADLAALDELLAANPELWPAYQDAVHLHVCLRQRFAVRPAPAPPARRGWRRAAFALAACAAAVLVAWVAMRPAGEPRAFATLTALQGELADGNAGLAGGRVRLVAGLAEVTFQSGTVVVLEGPAELNAEAADRGVLVAGRASVKVPASAGRFSVDTPAGRVSDGPADAEFGIDVGADGATVVQVYGGAVEAGGRPIAAGGAVRFAVADSSPIPFVSTRFVREMPPFETRPGTGNDQKQPYNSRPASGQRIPWAAAPPKVDGDLGEWDRTLAVSGKCDPPFDEAYRATLFAAYDDNSLYLAAEVADPYPLRNRADVATGTETWAGGSVIVRLSTDPSLGFPVDQWKPDLNLKRPPTPQNTSERLNHLILWYSRPDERACLDATFGMDEHGKRRNPAGVTGAASRWPDGRGYTMEYAVPWAALAGADARPRPGDVTGICWQVHWADAAGRDWRGQLMEVLTPGETGLVFHNARRWGRADWLAPGTR